MIITGDVIMTNDNILCCCCGKTFDENGVHKGRIRKDGTVKRCKTCNWIYRHGSLPVVDGFTEYDVRYALEFILIGKSLYLNNLAADINRTLDDVIYLVNSLGIKGKKYMLKLVCPYCGKSFDEYVSVYLQNEYTYCSWDCYVKHKREIVARGEDSDLYNRIETHCTNCDKKIYVTPSKYNEVNSFGENHNFCSQECYWEYRSKYYTGDKSARINTNLTQNHKMKMRTGFVNWLQSSRRLDSGIQITINNILNNNNIRYIREYQVGYYAVDNFLTDSNLMIEVMGDYWHASPLVYSNYNDINSVQRKDVSKDKSKHTYIKNKYGIEILYLWENDIKNNIDMCESLILRYIENNGILSDYNSFNWSYIDGELKLNENIIMPYQFYCKNIG